MAYTVPTGDTSSQLDTKRGESGTINRNVTTPLAPTATSAATPAAIPASTLQSTQTPYDIPKQNVEPSTSNLALSNTTVGSNIKADASVEAPIENKAKAALADDFTKVKEQIFGTDADVDQVRKEEDIYNKKKAATAADDAIDKLDREYQAKIAEIKKNPQSKQADVIEQNIADEYDRYHNNRANLALEYKVAAGAYNDAVQIVNDKIASLDKRNTNALNLYQLAVNAVNNDLTESEKLIVQSRLQEKQQQQKLVSDAYSSVLANAVRNTAPASVLSAIDEASRQPGATAATIAAAAGRYAQDPLEQAQIANLYSQITDRQATAAGFQDPSQIIAYAQQYASNGQIPSGLPKGAFGLVSQVAKELPKPDGTLVDVNTGVKSGALSNTQEDGIVATRDLLKKLDDAQAYFNSYPHGILAGAKNAVLPSTEAQKYNDLKSEIVDLLARARTGAVLTAQEERTYGNKLPGNFNKPGFFGRSGNTSIDDLKRSLAGKLNTTLQTHGVAIYGYSPVKIGGQTYTVGQIVSNNQGQSGRVNADGTITILQ